MKRSIVPVLVCLVLVAAACTTTTSNPTASPAPGASAAPTDPGATATPVVTAAPGAPMLDVGYDVISIELTKTRAVPVSASVGDVPASFDAAPLDGPCFSLVPRAEAVRVVAGNTPCTDSFTVTAEGVPTTKTVTVNVFDPSYMDIGEGLLIKYVKDFSFGWNDAGTDSDLTTGMWHPTAPAGWFPLGDLFTLTDNTPNGSEWAIVVQDSLGAGTLAAPTGWTWLWADSDSGGDFDATVFYPVCPAGYVALGAVVNPANFDHMRCVAERFTVLGTPGPGITNDNGSGGDYSYAINGITPPTGRLPENKIAMSANTQTFYGDGGQSQPYFLTLVPPVVEVSNIRTKPKLTGCQPLTDEELGAPFATRATRVPFSLLGDKANAATIAGRITNVSQSPFYVLRRETSYTQMVPPYYDNCTGSTGVQIGAEASTGSETNQSSSFSQEVGVSVSSDIGPVSAEITATLGWSQTESSTYSTQSVTKENKCVPPGHFGQFLVETTTFHAIAANGTDEGAVSVGLSGTLYLGWPPFDPNGPQVTCNA